MSNHFKWGILGTGVIAGKFAADLPASDSCALAAVGSRAQNTADRFIDRYPARGYDSYQAVLEDAEVEAVYNSLPNGLHHEWTIKALRAGKHVLCEKPFAANHRQAEEMFQVAEETGKVLIEAFMYRCRPLVQKLIATVRSGALGEVRVIRSNFTFSRPALTTDARYQLPMAGGSLMDVGCYCMNLTRALAGAELTAAQVMIHRHPLGVDDYAAGTLRFGADLLTTFTCGMTVHSDMGTYVGGTEGYLHINNPWFSDDPFTRVDTEGRSELVTLPNGKPLYALEADAFARTVRDGVAPWITRADTLANMRLLDDLRKQAGLPLEV